ncbi:hypothetical protein THAOC_09125 [Thalassiosira oceanica]|uniref:Uncharacterized protein n=1 Tax=Thalassiosira oceanica TaxID=159749 RepID=K0SXC7_THAOC|nr:hypothetical protein THAOC_09125 [Thalassiosira oceanica]|eukprot:EJK69599.1 hypothetical protein THAOC_09125 [Thalassiosira oceanica]
MPSTGESRGTLIGERATFDRDKKWTGGDCVKSLVPTTGMAARAEKPPTIPLLKHSKYRSKSRTCRPTSKTRSEDRPVQTAKLASLITVLHEAALR